MINPFCNRNKPELKAYLDGQLPLIQRLRVRRHLRSCAACREELSFMEQISNELHADGPKPLDHSLRARILNAVSQAGPTETPPAPAKPARKRLRPLTVCAGAATAIVAWFTLYPLLHGDVLRSITTGSQTPKSQSNLKQIGLGAGMYTQDYDESRSQEHTGASSVAQSEAIPATGSGMGRVTPSQQLLGGPMKPEAQIPDIETRSARKRQTRDTAGYGNRGYVSSFDHQAGEEQRRIDSGRTERFKSLPHQVQHRTSPLMITEGGRREVLVAQAPASKLAQRAQSAAAPSVQQQLDTLAGEEKVERTVNHTATVTVQVDSVETRSETVAQYAQTAGGFVANNQLSTGDDDAKTATLTLKVPVAQFETVLNQVARLGEVKAKNLTGEDLTDQISDQEQSEHILRQDINTTQEELTHHLTRSGRQERLDSLRELRTRIAQTSARLKLLRKLGALSTISVELDEKPRVAPPAPKTGGFVDDMNNALHGAMRSMVEAARLPILAFIWILAYSPLWILLILGYRYAKLGSR
jgi:hypothetical protein